MTQPRPVTPVARSAAPVARAAVPAGRPAAVGSGSVGGINVSPDTVAIRVQFGVRRQRERIQIVGDFNSGKTFAVLQEADREFRENGPNAAKFFWIDMDDTMSSYLNEECDFEHLNFENGGNVYPVFAGDWDHYAAAVKLVRSMAKDGDWVVQDTIGRAYEYAQEKIAIKKGLNIDDAVVNRGLAKKGFGAFDGDTWNLVNRTFEAALKPLLFQTGLNLVFISHVGDLQDGREKRQVLTMFDQVGLKPRGAPKIPGMANTVVFLWLVRKIRRDENKKRIDAQTVHMMTIVKDHGKFAYAEEPYGHDFFAQLRKIRKERVSRRKEQIEVTDRDQARDIADAAFKELATGDPDDNLTAQSAGLGARDEEDPDDDEPNPDSPESLDETDD